MIPGTMDRKYNVYYKKRKPEGLRFRFRKERSNEIETESVCV